MAAKKDPAAIITHSQSGRSTSEASQMPINGAILKKIMGMANTILARNLNYFLVVLSRLMPEEADSVWLVWTSIRILPTDEFMMARCGIHLLEIWEEEIKAVLDVEAALDEQL